MELAVEVCEEEFRAKYMTEDRGIDMAINFISTESYSRDKVHAKEEVGKTFDTVESMIKGVFPQLLNVKDGKVGQAENCAHEIHLKPGTVHVKRRVSRVPVHQRDELKASIYTMLASGIIRRLLRPPTHFRILTTRFFDGTNSRLRQCLTRLRGLSKWNC